MIITASASASGTLIPAITAIAAIAAIARLSGACASWLAI
jgi:hypothetical protein